MGDPYTYKCAVCGREEVVTPQLPARLASTPTGWAVVMIDVAGEPDTSRVICPDHVAPVKEAMGIT